MTTNETNSDRTTVGAPGGRHRLGLAIRGLLIALGVIAGFYGLVELSGQWPTVLSLGIWLAAGAFGNDAVLIPIVIGTSLLLVRWIRPGWRSDIGAGMVVTGILVLLAIPPLVASRQGHPNPTLADRDYGVGLVVAIAVVWLVVAVTAGIRTVWRRTKSRRRPPG